MGSLSFDGTDDRATRSTSPVTAAPFTVCAWVKRTSSGSKRQIWSYIDNDFDGWYFSEQAGTVRHEVHDGTTATATASASLAASTWDSVAAVEAAANDRRVFVGGTNKGTNTTSKTPNVNNSPDMTVGAWRTTGFSEHFQGFIGYLGVWNIALSDAEVDEFHDGTLPQQSSLVAFYDFTVAPVAGVYADLTGNGYDLTVDGATFDTGETPPVSYSLGASVPVAAGALTFAGLAASLGFTILMPDEL